MRRKSVTVSKSTKLITESDATRPYKVNGDMLYLGFSFVYCLCSRMSNSAI